MKLSRLIKKGSERVKKKHYPPLEERTINDRNSLVKTLEKHGMSELDFLLLLAMHQDMNAPSEMWKGERKIVLKQHDEGTFQLIVDGKEEKIGEAIIQELMRENGLLE